MKTNSDLLEAINELEFAISNLKTILERKEEVSNFLLDIAYDNNGVNIEIKKKAMELYSKY